MRQSGATVDTKFPAGIARADIDTAVPTGTIQWQWYYAAGMLVDSARKLAGVRAFKRALIDAGYGKDVIVDVQAWGDAAVARTREFQAVSGVAADGIVGPVTARYLLRPYASAAEAAYSLPRGLVARVKTWESDNDPVCRGYTGDEGDMQINPPNHPEITLAQMWDPGFSIHWAGGYLRGAFIYVGGDWDGATAAYNVGGYGAKQWVAAGKPTSGGPVIGTDPSGKPIELYSRCASYVAHVKAADY